MFQRRQIMADWLVQPQTCHRHSVHGWLFRGKFIRHCRLWQCCIVNCARPDQRLDCIKPRLLRRIQPPNWKQFANPGGLEPSHGHPTGRRGHILCRVGIDGQARCRWNLECKCQWQDHDSHRPEHQRIKLSRLCSSAHLRGR